MSPNDEQDDIVDGERTHFDGHGEPIEIADNPPHF
jgi:hypothetical protein